MRAALVGATGFVGWALLKEGRSAATTTTPTMRRWRGCSRKPSPAPRPWLVTRQGTTVRSRAGSGTRSTRRADPGGELIRAKAVGGGRHVAGRNRHPGRAAAAPQCAQLLQLAADEFAKGLHPIRAWAYHQGQRGHQRGHRRVPARVHNRASRFHRASADGPAAKRIAIWQGIRAPAPRMKSAVPRRLHNLTGRSRCSIHLKHRWCSSAAS